MLCNLFSCLCCLCYVCCTITIFLQHIKLCPSSKTLILCITSIKNLFVFSPVNLNVLRLKPKLNDYTNLTATGKRFVYSIRKNHIEMEFNCKWNEKKRSVVNCCKKENKITRRLNKKKLNNKNGLLNKPQNGVYSKCWINRMVTSCWKRWKERLSCFSCIWTSVVLHIKRETYKNDINDRRSKIESLVIWNNFSQWKWYFIYGTIVNNDTMNSISTDKLFRDMTKHYVLWTFTTVLFSGGVHSSVNYINSRKNKNYLRVVKANLMVQAIISLLCCHCKE